MLRPTRRSGFTIVELLIVIVVIGILAALVLNSFGDAQRNARNAQMISAAKAYRQILVSYAVQNGGQYPLAVGTRACLGEKYTDTNSDGLGNCGDNYTTSVNTAFNTALKTVSPTLPYPENAKPMLGPDGTTRYGMFLYYINDNDIELFYFLEGSNQDCKATVSPGISGSNSATTWCGLYMPRIGTM